MEGSNVPVRRAVSTLDRSEGIPAELRDYGEGIRKMSELHASEPWSLSYQAAIHARDGEANRQNNDWDWCQHQNWFFLPWHRMYLRQFEKILCHLIGKPDWRLPYWDYTAPEEATWAIPREFLEPAERSNPLWVDGRLTSELTRERRDITTALAAPRFEILGNAGFGFGSGRIDRPQQFGARQTGEVEGTPHNVVHSGIGGPLGDPRTAALDPLFWLHHANIDRVWEVWLAQDDPQRQNPGDDVWLDTTFDFPDPGGRVSYRVREVLSTFEIGYLYDDVTPPPVEERRRVIVLSPLEEAVEEPVEPELIGATDDAVPLAPGATHIVGLQPADEWQLSKRAQAAGVLDERREVSTATTELALNRRVLLQLEKVTGTEIPYGIYGVYVNVPEGEDPSDYPNLKAGLFAPFGLELATAQGDGMTQSYDITEIARQLYDDGRWDPARVDVSFDAEVPKPSAEEETRRSGEPARGDVQVGSIRVYVE